MSVKSKKDCRCLQCSARVPAAITTPGDILYQCKCGAVTITVDHRMHVSKVCACGIIVEEIAPEPGPKYELRLFRKEKADVPRRRVSKPKGQTKTVPGVKAV